MDTSKQLEGAAHFFLDTQKAGRLSQKEMDLTFNNGLGMILIVGKREIKGVERSLRSMGQPYDLVGELAKGARGVSFVP